MFSQYCENKYTAEQCIVQQPSGKSHFYPELAYRHETIGAHDVRSVVGIGYVIH